MGTETRRQMPPRVAEVFDELSIEVHLLHGRWTVYKQLFAQSQKRREMLSECAGGFFNVVYNVLWAEIVISLCKLNEPAKSHGFDNLSLRQIQKRLVEIGEVDLADETRALLCKYGANCGDFRTWRDKQLAHLNLDFSVVKDLNPLPPISREMIEGALALVRDFMNLIEGHYRDGTSGYEHFWMEGDGDALVEALIYGVRYEELFQERKIPLNDWRQCKYWGA